MKMTLFFYQQHLLHKIRRRFLVQSLKKRTWFEEFPQQSCKHLTLTPCPDPKSGSFETSQHSLKPMPRRLLVPGVEKAGRGPKHV